MNPAEKQKPPKRRQVVAVKSLLLRGGKALILRRSPSDKYSPGIWELPGGRLEYGESPREALVREITEETGLAATVGPLLYAEAIHFSPEREIIVINHLCYAGPGQVTISFEHQDHFWGTASQLAEMLDGDILRNLRRNNVFSRVEIDP